VNFTSKCLFTILLGSLAQYIHNTNIIATHFTQLKFERVGHFFTSNRQSGMYTVGAAVIPAVNQAIYHSLDNSHTCCSSK